MPNKKCILIDCDDVICDYKTPALAFIHQLFGIEIDLTNFPHWDLFSAITDEQRELLLDEMGRPGHCYSLEVLPGAKEGIELLRQEGDVVVVTRPVLRPTWVYERTHWLIDKLGFDEYTIINTAVKRLVWGNALLDDNPENVLKWQEYHLDGAGLMWGLPNTEHMREMDSYRVKTWDAVVERVRAL